MSSIIFKNERVKKSEWYTWFLSKWTEAGWTDISSNPNVDNAVMYSEGEKGDKSLYIGFAGDIMNSASSSTNTLRIRHCRTYTPNVVYGSSGKFEMNTYHECLVCGDITPNDINHELNMWYYVNKNWGMFITDGHLVRGGNPSCIFVGQPNIELGPGDKTNIIVAGSKIYGSTNYNNMAIYTGDPFSTPTNIVYLPINVAWNNYSITNTVSRTCRQDPQLCSTIVYGHANFGYRFQLDDSILITSDAYNISHSMKYNVNGQIYKFFNVTTNRTGYYNSFYSGCIGIRIS